VQVNGSRMDATSDEVFNPQRWPIERSQWIPLRQCFGSRDVVGEYWKKGVTWARRVFSKIVSDLCKLLHVSTYIIDILFKYFFPPSLRKDVFLSLASSLVSCAR
jgi:hypothetical protein